MSTPLIESLSQIHAESASINVGFLNIHKELATLQSISSDIDGIAQALAVLSDCLLRRDALHTQLSIHLRELILLTATPSTDHNALVALDQYIEKARLLTKLSELQANTIGTSINELSVMVDTMEVKRTGVTSTPSTMH